MSSFTVSDFKEDTVTLQHDDVSEDLEEVGDRLVSLSEKINLCNIVLNDLKDLNDVLLRKCLQDVSVPLQK